MDLNDNAIMAERSKLIEIVRQIYLSQALVRQIRRDDALGVRHWLRLGADPNAVGCIEMGDPMILLTVTDCLVRREESRPPYTLFDLPLRKRRLCSVPMPGNRSVIESLLAAGADVNARRRDGSTLLIYVASFESGDFAQFLLKNGADINASDIDGNTSLHAAAGIGNVAALHVLLDAGASLDAVGKDYMTPLLAAISGGFSSQQVWPEPACAFELVRRGSDVTLADGFGNTASHYAAGYGNPQLLRVLYDAGADVNAQNKVGQTPLMKASGATDHGLSQYIHIDNVSELIALGADVDIANSDGDTALHLASRFGESKIVELLIENGAKLDVQNHAGETPLIVTVKEIGSSYGRVNAGVATALLRRGSDPDIRDSTGKTADDYLPELFGRSMSEIWDVWSAKLKIAKSRLFRR